MKKIAVIATALSALITTTQAAQKPILCGKTTTGKPIVCKQGQLCCVSNLANAFSTTTFCSPVNKPCPIASAPVFK